MISSILVIKTCVNLMQKSEVNTAIYGTTRDNMPPRRGGEKRAQLLRQ